MRESNRRANRGGAIETNMFAIGSFGPGFPATPKPWYPAPPASTSTTTNRDMQKSLDRLAALQTDRKARQLEDLEELAALLEHNEIKHLPIKNAEIEGSNGFVFSIDRIHAFATRKRRREQAGAVIHGARRPLIQAA
jgi:hypothetical protein